MSQRKIFTNIQQQVNQNNRQNNKNNINNTKIDTLNLLKTQGYLDDKDQLRTVFTKQGGKIMQNINSEKMSAGSSAIDSNQLGEKFVNYFSLEGIKNNTILDNTTRRIFEKVVPNFNDIDNKRSQYLELQKTVNEQTLNLQKQLKELQQKLQEQKQQLEEVNKENELKQQKLQEELDKQLQDDIMNSNSLEEQYMERNEYGFQDLLNLYPEDQGIDISQEVLNQARQNAILTPEKIKQMNEQKKELNQSVLDQVDQNDNTTERIQKNLDYAKTQQQEDKDKKVQQIFELKNLFFPPLLIFRLFKAINAYVDPKNEAQINKFNEMIENLDTSKITNLQTVVNQLISNSIVTGPDISNAVINMREEALLERSIQQAEKQGKIIIKLASSQEKLNMTKEKINQSGVFVNRNRSFSLDQSSVLNTSQMLNKSQVLPKEINESKVIDQNVSKKNKGGLFQTIKNELELAKNGYNPLMVQEQIVQQFNSQPNMKKLEQKQEETNQNTQNLLNSNITSVQGNVNNNEINKNQSENLKVHSSNPLELEDIKGSEQHQI